MIDYDPCEECHLSNNDYDFDKDGDLVCLCYDCPLRKSGEDEG